MATEESKAIEGSQPTCMESVNRFSKLPVVESTIETATSLYEKVKDYNSVTNWAFSTAESTVNKAVEIGKPIVTPVIHKLEDPIKKVDHALCTGLDYVEAKVPAVKLPPGEIYTNTKEYLTPAMETARSYAEPAYKTAKDMVEPAVEKTKSMVEPYVQPAMDKANQIKEDILHKVDEYLHKGHECPTGAPQDCAQCKSVRDKLEQKKAESQQQQQEQETQNQQPH